MYFDTLTLSAVADELRATIVGGRVQRVVRPNALSIALEIYNRGRRHHLLMSAHPQHARVHLLGARASRGVEGETPMLLLLRKYVLGGHILGIEQPDLERIILLSIAKGPAARNTGDPAPDEPEEQLDELHRTELVVEAMDRRSNIILVGDDNIIKESVRHVSPLMSRRPVQPREPYELPPRQDKLNPRRATAAGLQHLAETTAEADFARALVSAYSGLSPQVAREVLFRAIGAAKAAPALDLPFEPLVAALHEILAGPWQPTLARGPEGQPLAYAPYPLVHLGGGEPQPSMSHALEAFYAAREQLTSHAQRRAALAEALGETRERLDRQRRQLAEQMQQASTLDRTRWEGEMIYAFLHGIRPGQTELEVEGEKIALNPGLTPVENAQARFRSYDKAKGALAHVPELLAATEARIAGLDERLALLAIADSFDQIEEIAREAEDQDYLKPSGKKRLKLRRQPPLRTTSSDGYTIYVGRSASQNEHVTFHVAAPDDMWLHVRGIPGAHVVIKGGDGVPERTIQEAAALAAYFSSARGDAAADVEVARRKHVRRVPGGPTGLVTYRSERSVRAAPQPPR